MSVTVHTFTELGFRTMPIGQTGATLQRNEEDNKKYLLDAKGKVLPFVHAMPSDWTQVYGRHRTDHLDTPLGGLICGKLENKQEDELEVIALDCDNQAAWDLFVSLHPDYEFKYKSIGKPGGTIIYLLPKELENFPQY